MYVAAAVVADHDAVIEHKLYWAFSDSISEGRFLTAILNSSVLTLAVRPLQGRGEHNPRDFDKYIFQLPIPLYDPANSDHLRLVELAERAEEIAASVELPPGGFEAQRRHIRKTLMDEEVTAYMDSIVKMLLA